MFDTVGDASRPITPDMPLRELLAPDPEPSGIWLPSAHIVGGASVPAPQLAQLAAAGATICRVASFTDVLPETGYRPSTQLARFILCRDLTCRFPGCDHPAEFCDIDHAIPYPVGPTHPSNLRCLCRKHQLWNTLRDNARISNQSMGAQAVPVGEISPTVS